TVLVHPGDNWMIHGAVEQCKPGDILVVGCSADNTDGMFGDLLATSLMARGVTGLVISPVAVFCPFDINSLHLQGLIHVVSQSPNSRPALWRLWRACAVLRGARRLRGVATRGDSRSGRVIDPPVQEHDPRRGDCNRTAGDPPHPAALHLRP